MKIAMKTVFLTLFVGLMISSFATDSGAVEPLASPPPAANLFFPSLIQAIDKVEGRFIVELQNGAVITQPIPNPPGQIGDIQWTIQPNTCATLVTSYAGGVLSGETQLKFSPTVTLTPIIAATGNNPHAISSITFDRFGVPSQYINSLGQVDTALKAIPFVQAQLILASSLPDLLSGKIFATLDPANGTAHDPSLLIRTIGFRKGPVCNETQAKPGLKVTLKDRALLVFSQSTTANPHNNFAIVQNPSGFEFDSLLYNVLTKDADSVLASLELTLQSGVFSSAGADIKLRQGSQLSVGGLSFHHDDQSLTNTIDGTFGTLSGTLGVGSRFVLSPENSTNPSSLTFDDGSKVSFSSFKIKLSDSSTEIEVGNTSSAVLRVVDGRLALGGSNYALMRDGLIVVDLTRTKWKSGAAPVLTGTIGLFACDVYAGQFVLDNPQTVAALKSGTLRAASLRLDSTGSPPITGAFSSFILDLQDGTSFGLINRYTAVLRDGARLTANDPQNPLQIMTGAHPVKGALIATLPFRRVFTNDPQGPVVRNGSLRSTIVIDASGNVSVSNVFLDGQINLQAELFKKRVDVTIDVTIEDGSWANENGTPILRATMQAKISTTGVTLPFKAPDCPLYGVARNDDIHRGHIKYLVYPIDVEISLSQPITIPPSAIVVTQTADATNISFGTPGKITTLDSEFTMDIPTASYKDDDDDFKASWPHLVRADCVSTGIGGTNDLRLAPTLYHVPFNLTFEATNPGVELRVHPRFPQLRVNFDACLSDKVALGIVILAAFALDPFKLIDTINNNNPGAIIQRALNQQFAQHPIRFLQ